MERLTQRLRTGEVLMASEYEEKYTEQEWISVLQDRLAAYEDTGLTPERCAEFARADAEGRYIVMRDAEQEGVARLRELAKADKDGRLVVLPCKVVCGTTIWWADSNFHTDPIKCEVSSFGIYTGPDGDLQVWMNCYVYGSTPMSKSFRMSSIGKTVFLSREEAEEALAQEGGTHEDSGGL